ncbi:MAG: efflux RND transporter periplasmic adaptor subunit [Planctomycetota bacterium]
MRKALRLIITILYRALSWLAAIGVLVGLVFLVRHVFRQEKAKREEAATKIEDRRVVPVRVAFVRRGALRETITVTGNVEALREVKLVSKLPGRIDELHVEECDAVTQGDVIAVIDHEQVEADLAQAEAAVSVANASIKTADVQLADALREKERMQKLFQEGAANEQAVDRATTAHDTAAAQLALVKAKLQEAEAGMRAAKVRLDDATVEAPISGIVSKKHLDQGNVVGKEDGIVTIVDVSTVKIMSDVSERYLSKIQVGRTKAQVAIDSLPGESFEGTLHKIHPALDERTRAADVEIRVANPKHRLMPGMYARVTLVLEERLNALIVPLVAVIREDGDARAFTLKADVATARPVRLGLRSEDQVEVMSGLKEGDTVVIEGQNNLTDGCPVQVIRNKGGE